MSVQYHIQCDQGDVGRYVLLPGDPGRCEAIANHFDNPQLIAAHREYVVYTGALDGEPVSAVSTGIGGPSTAIAVEELVRCGTHTFIRVGTCGGMQDDVLVNDIVIATAAIRFDGTSKEYMPIEFPAVANYDALLALDEASRVVGVRTHMGIVQCKDSFYGQHDPSRMPIRGELLAKWQAWIEGGCLASEMESATLFILGSIMRLRCGAVLAVAGNQAQGAGIASVVAEKKLANPMEFLGPGQAIRVGVEALRRLIRIDRDCKSNKGD